MFVILPFEKEFYAKFDMEVDYVGHPLLDAIQKRDQSESRMKQLREELKLGEREIVAILPGSRKQEISKMLPTMLKQAEYFSDYQFVIAAAPSFDLSFFDDYLSRYPQVKLVANRTYDLLELSSAALVTSGTATLETALFRVPEVVCYKGNFFSYHIAKRLVKVNYISLVNLIMDREIVKELIQQEYNLKLLRKELGKLLLDQDYRSQMLTNFDHLINQLGEGGASLKVAQLIGEDIKK